MAPVFFILAFLLAREDLRSAVKCSDLEFHDSKAATQHGEGIVDRDDEKLPRLEIILGSGNVTYDSFMENQLKRRANGDRIRKKKEKNGNLSKNKGKPQKTEYMDVKQMLRNNEKIDLVRNRTMEILKSGVRILSASGNFSPGDNKSMNHVNETLLEKILSSAASKPNMLISASGMYKVPIGGNLYQSKNGTEMTERKDVHRTKGKAYPRRNNVKEDLFGGIYEPSNGKSNQPSTQRVVHNDHEGTTMHENSDRIYFNRDLDDVSYINIDRDSMSVDTDVQEALQKIATALRNLTHSDGNESANCDAEDRSGKPNHTKDPCTKWLQCRNRMEIAFAWQNFLPSCPCHYPSSIFYNDAIWDENQKRFFRWRDASSEGDRLDIYKPGAAYCIRSLLEQGYTGISSQQCCYDKKLQLLTRGSGAGTINFVSPDISRALHDTVDVLPWRLCKGDFTRYNIARRPDNGNMCPVNPEEEQYQLQVKTSKFY